MIEVQTRTATGHAVKTIKRQGMIPAVVYGKGIESTNLSLEKNEWTKIVRDSTRETTLELNINGQTHTVNIHSVDRDPVKGDIRHIDFLIKQ